MLIILWKSRVLIGFDDKVRSQFPELEGSPNWRQRWPQYQNLVIRELSEPAFRMSGFPSPLIKEMIVHSGDKEMTHPSWTGESALLYNHSHQ